MVRRLVDRVRAEGGVAFVAGWKLDGRTVAAAFRRGLLVEVAPDLWAVPDAVADKP